MKLKKKRKVITMLNTNYLMNLKYAKKGVVLWNSGSYMVYVNISSFSLPF